MKHSGERGDHHSHHLNDDELELGYSSDSSFENYYLYSKEELILVNSLNDNDFKYSGNDTRDRVVISSILGSAKEKYGCSVAVEDLCDMIMNVKRNRTIWKARNRTRFPKSRTHANNDQNTLPRKTTTTVRRRRSPKRRKPSAAPHVDVVMAVNNDDVPEINPPASINSETQENPPPENPQPQNQPIPPPPPPVQAEINPPASNNAENQDNPPQENPQPQNQPIPPALAEIIPHPLPPIHYFTSRELKNSDMRDNQCRLTMPEAQIVDDSFFTEEEVRLLKVRQSNLEVQVMDPSKRTWDSNLRYRKAGNTSYCYTMGRPWNQLRRSNGFRERMIVHVCVLRRPDTGKLCIILQT